ncbi:hypothetical protein CDAR_488301 [Caerostris darwini]|uniref:Cysteine-rich transmembrane CYSTM domain-containing protein n=1 Tax=Caerostris darwini TaxID=1538125 RepID=A0AAV4Q380_9ARAC|nr:hypothetical protein CDAR_488301 [Caerostris darwini]
MSSPPKGGRPDRAKAAPSSAIADGEGRAGPSNQTPPPPKGGRRREANREESSGASSTSTPLAHNNNNQPAGGQKDGNKDKSCCFCWCCCCSCSWCVSGITRTVSVHNQMREQSNNMHQVNQEENINNGNGPDDRDPPE